MMTIEIRAGYPKIREEFEETVRAIFPVLCFEPDQIRAFLEEVEAGETVKELHVVDCVSRRRAFVGAERFKVAFIIPSDWSHRYEIVENAVGELQARPEQRAIRITIDERIPSHSAYFAGLLPRLGFEMEAKVGMVMNEAFLEEITLPPLPDGFVEVPLSHDRSAEAARVLHEAYSTQHPEWSPQQRGDELEGWLQFVSAEKDEELLLHWVAIERCGELVGVCLGRAPYGDAMAISELAVLPSYWRRGLGRYLTIRCMQKFRAQYVQPGRFRLSALRTNRAAIALYRSLGFKADEIFTRAVWSRQEPAR